MSIPKTKEKLDLVEIQGREWSDGKLAKMKEFIREQSAKRDPEQIRKNELLAIRYQMEDYVERSEVDKLIPVFVFVNLYLDAFDISFRKFSSFLGTTDSNLKKYVSGERKLNPDLARKFAGVFNTSADIWLRIQMKNDLIQLSKENRSESRYRKYNPDQLLKFAGHK